MEVEVGACQLEIELEMEKLEVARIFANRRYLFKIEVEGAGK